ncbi:MAG: ABC transporter permease subunit [Chloroflexi bacterium]|nr:ABC transporter permease subunit [Chloroflexota bacterium]
MGLFAPLVAPYDPLRVDLPARNTPPFWVEAETEARTVAQRVDKLSEEDRLKISLRDARKIKEDAAVGDVIIVITRPAGSFAHIAGTDQTGRDVLSRVIYGARVSLIVTAVSLTSGLIIGVIMGLVAGYADQVFPRWGKHLDEAIMRLVEITFAVPTILVALVIVIVFGKSFAVLLGLLAFVAWNAFPRNVRAEVLTLKTADYVALARVAGAGPFRVLFVHIFPGVINTVLVIATLRVGQLILIEAILSFLGAGVQPPKPAWGAMVADGREYLGDAWWIAFFPGLGIFLVVMALNFLGDWMRDRFDPKLRQLS